MSDDDHLALLDGIEEFFNAIKVKCLTYREYAAEILKARGFLLEGKKLILSDNSFFAKDIFGDLIPNARMNDSVYLNELLTEQHIGKVEDNKIIIFPGRNVEKIFYSNNWTDGGTCDNGQTFREFAHYNFAPKIPVRILEPFVARYVKAISACGVQTWLSCDGNHTYFDSQRILIEPTSGTPLLWYAIICNRCLKGRFNLQWSGYSKIILGDNKWKTYIELNRAAEFLYKHRIKIREIRRKALAGINKKMLKKVAYFVIDYDDSNKYDRKIEDELEEIFSERANKLFDELIFGVTPKIDINNDRVHCE